VALTSGTGCASDPAGFVCSLPSGLALNQHREFFPRFEIDPSFTGSSIPLRATVTSLGTFDSNPNDNSALATLNVVSRADMRAELLDSAPASPIVIEASSDPTKSTVIFQFRISNAGPSDARSAVPTVTGIDVDGFCRVAAGTDCSTPAQFSPTPPTIGTMRPGEAATVFFLVRAEPTLRHGPLSWDGVFSATSSTADPSSANDSLTRSVVVDTLPDPVTNLRATPGNTNVIVSWAAPATNGGVALDPATPYRLTASAPGFPVRTITIPPSAVGPCLAPEATVCFDVTTLVNGRTYTFDVVAINRIGASDAGVPIAGQGNIATPSTRSAARIVAPNATASLATCPTATTAAPVCISQLVVNKGAGGIVAIQAGVSLSATFCGGAPCAGNAGALTITSPRSWSDAQRPITAVVLWDASLAPTQQVVYVQQGGAAPVLLQRCMNGSKANPDPCLKTYQVLGGGPTNPQRDDRSATILFTSAAGFLTFGQP
jgi:hypothetical protein